MAEFLAPLPGVKFSARGALHDPKLIRQAKSYIKRAFEVQESKAGFSFVELLSICPANWGLSPLDSVKKLEELMIPEFPLGVIKDEQKAHP
jgi:2-oxoglutarate ferredoxin oxidoreductase subunit beta